MIDLKSKVEEYWKIILIILVGSCLVLIIYFNTQRKTEDISEIDPYEELLAEVKGEVDQMSETPLAEDEQTDSDTVAIMMADIKGAIHNPGVYKMEEGHRIIDLVEKAGGLLSEAESNAVNFAQKVEDQMVVYIPKVGEEDISIPASPVNKAQEQESGKVNINEADEAGLMTLNGIGSSKAASIIQHRDEKGFFKTIDEIKNVSGIGEATFNNLKDSITVSQ